MGLSDVYAPDFEQAVAQSIAESVKPLKDNPWLLGYFIGNEPAWSGDEVRLCDLILQGEERPIQKALVDYVARKGDTSDTRTHFIWDHVSSI